MAMQLMQNDLKTCTKCGESFPNTSEYFYGYGGRRGLKSWCKTCTAKAGKAWRASQPERAKAKSRANWKLYKLEHPDYMRDYNLRRCYGITLDEFDVLFAEQGYRCAICGVSNEDYSGKKSFHVDHDHATGAIRGILCHSCNIGLGNFKENGEVLHKAILYLGMEG